MLRFCIFEKGLTVGWIRRSRGSGRIREKEKNRSKAYSNLKIVFNNKNYNNNFKKEYLRIPPALHSSSPEY